MSDFARCGARRGWWRSATAGVAAYFGVFGAVGVVGASGCAESRDTVRFGSDLSVDTFRFHYNNAHLVERHGDTILVDAGLESDAPRLAEALRAAGHPPEKLKAIVLTHGHADHGGGAGWFHRQFGTPVIAGAGDAPILGQGHNDKLCPTDDSARRRLAIDQGATFTPYAADRLVTAPFNLEPVVGFPGRLVPLPGHTAGSLIVDLGEAVIVGDLFRGAIIGNGAEVHFYMCDLDGNRHDVETLLREISPFGARFFTGHFGPVSRSDVASRFGVVGSGSTSNEDNPLRVIDRAMGAP